MPRSVRGAEVAEPDGYRLEDYRAPTPATLRGARVVTTDQAEQIWRSHAAAFVDVLPRPPRPRDLPEGTLWRDKPRANIPGSVWLPDTGYGELAASMADYFASGLQKATGGDRARMVVIYCLANCWMSWNAAKRALRTRLFKRRLVSRRHRRLARRRPAAAGCHPGAASQPIGRSLRTNQALRHGLGESGFIAVWIALPKSNSRFSIRTGTSQT